MASGYYLPPISPDQKGDKSVRREATLYTVPANNVSRQYVYELEEKVKVLKDDIAKKDDLIRRLSNMEVKEVIRSVSSNEAGGVTPPRKTLYADYAALSVKYESLASQFKDKELECDMKREANQNTLREMELLKEDCARHRSIVEQLTKRLENIQEEEVSYETLRARSEAAVKTLQQHHQESQTRILELESRIRHLLNDREKSDHERGSFEKRFYNLVNEITHLLGAGHEATSENILSRISAVIQENASLRGDLVLVKEQLAAEEKERKTSNSALQQLADEIKKLKTDLDGIYQSREQMKEELERIRTEKSLLVKTQHDAEQKLGASQGALKALQVDYKDLEVRFLRLEDEKQFGTTQIQQGERQLQVFLETVSSLLTTAYSHCPPSESCIKERIRALAKDYQESKETIRSLEHQLKSTIKQADQYTESLHDKTLRLKRNEVHQLETEDHRRHLEAELGSVKSLYELLRIEKEKTMNFIQQLRTLLNMETPQGDLPIETFTKDILDRVHRLLRIQSGLHDDPLNQLHEARKRVKHLQNQLKEKETTVNTLEEKVLKLKEKLIHAQREAGICTIGVDQFDSSQHGEKLWKDTEIGRLRQRIDVLLEENSELRLRVNQDFSKNKDTEKWELQRNLEKLERVRQKQAEKIAELTSKLQEETRRQNESRMVAENAVQSLSNELRGTRSLLEASQRRENQLMDLRTIFGRTLGLNMGHTIIPDFEIINRLERVVMGEITVSYPPHVNVDSREGRRHRKERDRLDYEDLRNSLSPEHSSHHIGDHHQHRQDKHNTWRESRHRRRSLSPQRPDIRQY